MSVESLITFAEENILLIIVAVIAIILLISLVKTVLKWVFVAAVIIGILAYGFNYDVTKLKETAEAIGKEVVNYSKEQAVQFLIGDVKNAHYDQGSDGTYTITGNNVKLEGKIGADTVKLIYMGQPFDIKIDEKLLSFIEEVRAK